MRFKSLDDFNHFAERYNAAVDSILTDAERQSEFMTILDEKKAVMIEDGGMSEYDAEACIRQPDNLRRAAMCLMAN